MQEGIELPGYGDEAGENEFNQVTQAVEVKLSMSLRAVKLQFGRWNKQFSAQRLVDPNFNETFSAQKPHLICMFLLPNYLPVYSDTDIEPVSYEEIPEQNQVLMTVKIIAESDAMSGIIDGIDGHLEGRYNLGNRCGLKIIGRGEVTAP